MSAEGVGAEFAHSLAVKDFTSLRGLLKDDIDFRGMTPGSFWETNDADKVIGEILTEWFEDEDEIQGLVECSTSTVAIATMSHIYSTCATRKAASSCSNRCTST